LNSRISNLIEWVERGQLPIHEASRACDLPHARLAEIIETNGLYGLQDALKAQRVRFESGQSILKFKVSSDMRREFEEACDWMTPDQLFMAMLQLWRDQHAMDETPQQQKSSLSS
jgi:hypothetical protein